MAKTSISNAAGVLMTLHCLACTGQLTAVSEQGIQEGGTQPEASDPDSKPSEIKEERSRPGEAQPTEGPDQDVQDTDNERIAGEIDPVAVRGVVGDLGLSASHVRLVAVSLDGFRGEIGGAPVNSDGSYNLEASEGVPDDVELVVEAIDVRGRVVGMKSLGAQRTTGQVAAIDSVSTLASLLRSVSGPRELSPEGLEALVTKHVTDGSPVEQLEELIQNTAFRQELGARTGADTSGLAGDLQREIERQSEYLELEPTLADSITRSAEVEQSAASSELVWIAPTEVLLRQDSELADLRIHAKAEGGIGPSRYSLSLADSTCDQGAWAVGPAINNETGLLSGVPTSAAVGGCKLAVVVVDGSGRLVATVNVTVQSAPDFPAENPVSADQDLATEVPNPKAPPTPDPMPSDASLEIEEGDYTAAATVTLRLSAESAAEMKISNTDDCSTGHWEPYAEIKDGWALGVANSLAAGDVSSWVIASLTQSPTDGRWRARLCRVSLPA